MPRVSGSGVGRGGTVLSNSSSDDEGALGQGAAAARRPGAPTWGSRAGKPPSAQRNAWAQPGGGGGGGGKEEGGGVALSTAALFASYLEAGGELGDDLGKDQVFEAGLSRVRDHLTNVDSSCCLICLNHIRPTEAVWHCGGGCYTVLHLVCIQEWARSQLDAAGAKAAARLSQFPAAAQEARATAEWGCPKCRTSYPATAVPREYRCFCGKASNPEFDPWVAAHSCGEVCGKPLSGGCGHSCLLLCHPGPCPPCPLVVDAACYCGRKALKRRCGHNEYSCEGPCGRTLECGHRCPEVCHPGDCPSCPIVGDYACACGAERRRLPCGERRFHCTRVCGKKLSCGNCTCKQVCHSGPCGECPLAGAVTCPCGKVTYDDLSCTDKVPTCGATCGKLLPCGVHRCADRCHHGECTAQCRGPAIKTCRCGRSSKEVLCFQEFTCERRCAAMRACGRHPCKRRCCDGNCPPCEEVCGRRLRCGNHKCPAPCHSGPCRPCPLTSTVTCACGTAHCTLPCGAEARAEPPACPRPCAVPRICRHAPTLPPHRCHFGPCPPCPEPCATPLTCGHRCASAACHDPFPPPVPDFQPPPPPKAPSASQGQVHRASVNGGIGEGDTSGPAVRYPATMAIQALAALASRGDLPSPCPPCREPVPVTCVGGHGTQHVPCCEAAPYSCGAPCGRPLACGNHTCAMACHALAASGGGGAAGASSSSSGGGASGPLAPVACRQCDRQCDRPRPAGCSHPCPLKCHPGSCPRCEAPVRAACLCGKTTLQLPCHEAAQAAAAKAAGGPLSCGKPCHRQLAHCPHPCRAVCHAGPCPDPTACPEEVTVRCSCPAKRKAKWPCSRVQAELAKQGKPRTYDATTQLRLLPCDADCEQHKSKTSPVAQPAPAAAAAAATGADARGLAASANGSISTGSLSDAAASSAGAGAAGGKGGRVKLTRAEREAVAAQKEAERRRQERTRGIVRGVVLGVVVLLGVGLALLVQQLLLRIDAKLRTDPVR